MNRGGRGITGKHLGALIGLCLLLMLQACAEEQVPTGDGADVAAREHFRANPVSAATLQALEDCMVERVGVPGLQAGPDGGPPPDEHFEAYEQCATELGVLDEVRYTVEGGELAEEDVALANEEASEQAACLEERGWSVTMSAPDADGLIGWEVDPLTVSGAEGQEALRQDVEACGGSTETGAGSNDGHEHLHDEHAEGE